MRTFVILFLVAAATVAGVAWHKGYLPLGGGNGTTDVELPKPPEAPAPARFGQPLYPRFSPPIPAPVPSGPRSAPGVDPLVIADCPLTVFEKQDVPSERDGVIDYIGMPLQAGQPAPPRDRVRPIRVGDQERFVRIWKEDDHVRADQVLAQLVDTVPRHEYENKILKIKVAEANLRIAEKIRDETEQRYNTQLRLYETKSTSLEDLRGAKLNWDRYSEEAKGKKVDIEVAQKEAVQAEAIVKMYQIRSKTGGVITTIYKRPGEAVKANEPLFQIHNLDRLRVEGRVELQYRSRVQPGMPVLIEPAQAWSHEQTKYGHRREVTSIAVSQDRINPLIVSASEDGSVRVWDLTENRERAVWYHPPEVGVRAVACTPPGATGNWCLSGAADGHVRLWDLTRLAAKEPVWVSDHKHQGAATCVAFSPDGKWAASGGEDKAIHLWDTRNGKLVYTFPEGHLAEVTAVQFTPEVQLVSVGRDQTLRVWDLGTEGARLLSTIRDRSGDVNVLGVHPSGKQVLFDQGKMLTIMSAPIGQTEGVLHSPAGSLPFTTLALFSPDGRLILTAGSSEGRLQFWRTPSEGVRGEELRQLVTSPPSPTTCAAFSPDGTFVVSGTKNRQVLVWRVPTQEELVQQIVGTITRVEPALEAGARQIRIWAEVDNPTDPSHRLLPGNTVTMVIYPAGK
jgi:WD40 repeat protein